MKSDWAGLLSVEGETVPPGWKTAAQIGEEIGLGRARTIVLLKRAGKGVEMRRFRIECGGCVRPVPHYRILTGTKPVR